MPGLAPKARRNSRSGLRPLSLERAWGRCRPRHERAPPPQRLGKSQGSVSAHSPSRPPPADMLPEDMLPEDSEALAPPQPRRDDAASPSNVCHTVFEEQVKVAEKCMQYCREMIDKLEDILEASQPDTGGLAEKFGKHWCSWLQKFGKARGFRTSPSVGWRWLPLFI